MIYNPTANPPCYTSKDEGLSIQENDEVRVKITGVGISPPDRVTVVGTMLGDYLGGFWIDE